MQRSKRVLIGIAVAALTLAAACGGSDSNSGQSGGGGSTESIRGQTITVLVPYAMPQKLLDQFTAETGVKVNYVRTGWDATHNKLLVANQANSYIADVAEFDWSFTGQFAGAQWVEPLDGLVAPSTLSDLKSTDAAFMSGGKTYAACYSNDFRVSMYNKKMFDKAGITEFPATLDELGQDVAKLKQSGVQYPLSIPMAATEGGVTPWYLLTLAMGGQLFDDQLNPTFSDTSSAGYKALQWEADAVKNGWVSPGSVSMDDSVAFDKFTAGETAIVLATGPGNMATANDKSQSNIAGDAAIGLVPGVDGPGRLVRPARGPLDPGDRQAQGGRRGVHRVVGAARERDRDLQDAGQPAVRRLDDQAARRQRPAPGRRRPERGAAARLAAVRSRRADLVLAVQLRRPGAPERGGQG